MKGRATPGHSGKKLYVKKTTTTTAAAFLHAV